MTNVYQIETKNGPKTWRALSYNNRFATLDAAKVAARDLDQDGALINVRIRCPDGSIVKPRNSFDW